MSTRNLTAIYFVISIIFIALEIMESVWLAIFVKALIIPTLMLLYFTLAGSKMNTFHRLILAGLFFSWVGDVTLQLQRFSEMFFIIGLSGFLVAQVFYMVAFFTTKGDNILFFKRIWLLVPVILYCAGVLWLLFDGLGDMLIPVFAYAVVIHAMLTAAINRKAKVNRLSFTLVLIGAILFILSDSLIAINKFTWEIPMPRLFIMSTYVTAQYLIAIGCLKQYNIELK
jgi:uncharacterized membrane protein YhhN